MLEDTSNQGFGAKTQRLIQGVNPKSLSGCYAQSISMVLQIV